MGPCGPCPAAGCTPALPSAFKDVGVRGLNFGGACPPQCAPHPLSVPHKPVSCRRVHITSVLVMTTCQKWMEVGKLTWKMPCLQQGMPSPCSEEGSLRAVLDGADHQHTLLGAQRLHRLLVRAAGKPRGGGVSRHLPPRQREKRWVGEGLLPVPGAVVSRALSRVRPGPSLLPFPGSLPAHLPVWLPKTHSLLPTLPCTTSSINFFLCFSLCGSLSLFFKCFPVSLVPHCILISLSTFPSLWHPLPIF